VVTTNALGTVYGPDQTLATQALYGTAAVLASKATAPGIPGAIFSMLGNPALNDSDHTAFQAMVTGSVGSGVIASGTGANNTGIWAESGTNGRMLMVRAGMTAPGYCGSGTTVGTFATLSDPVYAGDDTIAFLGTLVKTGTVTVANNIGIWASTSGSLALVARIGDPASDASGSTSASSPVFAKLTQFALPEQGGIIVVATLQTGVGGATAANSQGIWAMDATGVLKRIIGTGDALTISGSARTVFSLTIFNAPATATGQTRHFNPLGDVICKAGFANGSSGVLRLEPTASGRYAATAVVLTKDPAPGIPGAIFSVLGNPIVTDSNHTAFQATVTGSATAGIIASGSAANNSGIWADSGTHGRMLIVRTGTTAPGYAGSGPAVGTFATLSDPVYADDDAVAFLGTLVKTGGVTVANNTGVWATASGSLALVARTGDPAPDASGSTSASSPVFAVFSQFVLPSRGGVIVFATLKTGVAGVVAANSQGIWAVDASGVLKQIIRTGAALTVNGSAKIVSSLMVFNAPAYPAGQTRHFNNSGDLIYKVIFSDSSSGVVQSVFP